MGCCFNVARSSRYSSSEEPGSASGVTPSAFVLRLPALHGVENKQGLPFPRRFSLFAVQKRGVSNEELRCRTCHPERSNGARALVVHTTRAAPSVILSRVDGEGSQNATNCGPGDDARRAWGRSSHFEILHSHPPATFVQDDGGESAFRSSVPARSTSCRAATRTLPRTRPARCRVILRGHTFGLRLVAPSTRSGENSRTFHSGEFFYTRG